MGKLQTLRGSVLPAFDANLYPESVQFTVIVGGVVTGVYISNGVSWGDNLILVKRINDKIVPTNSRIYEQNYGAFETGIRIVSSQQNVLQGLFDAVEPDGVVIDNDAAFTTDLLGKTIMQLTSNDNTNTDGTVTRAPNFPNGNWEHISARIIEVISSTKLRLSNDIFRPGKSYYYAIDNHTGKIIESLKGFITTDTASKLIDNNAVFTGAVVGNYVLVYNGFYWYRSIITALDSATQLSLDVDIPTIVGRQYIIIISDDAYRFIQSAADDVSNNSFGYNPFVVAIKNGVYRESVFVGTRSSEYNHVGSDHIIFTGDNRQNSSVVIKGSFATTPTTISSTFGLRCSGSLRIVSIGISYNYTIAALSSSYSGSIVIEKSTISNVISAAVGVGLIKMGDCIFNNVSLSIFSTQSQGGEGYFYGSIEIQTNMNLVSHYSQGVIAVFVDGATISGAGTLSGGDPFVPYIGAKVSGTSLPKLTDGSSVWERYFQTTKTAATATAGVGALPATPEGFIIVYVNGAQKKIPYYNA